MKNFEDQMEIRRLEPEDLDQYNDLLRYAFQVTERTLARYGWESDDIRQSKFIVLERATVLGWFEGKKLASQIAIYPIRMNVHNAVYSIGFITSVATYPEYSGQGLMSSLMKQTLLEMKENSQSLALLFPYSVPLYRHRGWEFISDKMTYQIKDYQLPKPGKSPGYVRRVAQDHEDLFQLHSLFANQTHGCLFRNRLAWDEYWRWDEDDTAIAIYYSQSDEPLGYMVYLLKNDVMHIKEMIYMNMESWKGLWNYIGAHGSMVTEVRGNNYFSEPTAFWLEDSDIIEQMRPYIMGRIIDLPLFISQYNFTNVTSPLSLCMAINDPLLPWNEGIFTLYLSPGEEPRIVKEGTQPQLELSIGTLTCILLGYKRAKKLYDREQMKGDRQAVLLLDQLVPQEKAYISDYI